MPVGTIIRFGKETQEVIGEISITDQPSHIEFWRVAICSNDNGQQSLDIRKYVDCQVGKPFTGLTREGVRLYSTQMAEFLKTLETAKEKMNSVEPKAEMPL